MIDKIFYAIFGWFDEKIENLWTFDIGQELKKKKKKK